MLVKYLEDFPDYIAAGKYCIAKVLKGHEIHRNLFPPNAGSPSWYEYLINTIDLGSKSYFDKNLTVLTFNYDRSLEHYLWNVIESLFRDDHRVMDNIWDARPEIIHLHGQLGPYAHLSDNATPYVNATSMDDLEYAQQDIHIISEMDPHDGVFDRAEEILENAERIYFLGFGFEERNVRRLRYFPQKQSDEKIVGGTRLRIDNHNWGEINAWMFGPEIERRGSFRDSTIYDFLSRPDVLG